MAGERRDRGISGMFGAPGVGRRPDAQPGPTPGGVRRRFPVGTPLPYASDAAPQFPDRTEADRAATLLSDLQRFDTAVRLERVRGSHIISGSATLVAEALSLSPDARHGVEITTVGRGSLDDFGVLETGGLAPITANLEVHFPDAENPAQTRVVSIPDGVLYQPYDADDRRRRDVHSLLDVHQRELPHEEVTRLAEGMILLATRISNMGQDASMSVRDGLNSTRNLLIDRYLRRAIRLEEQNSQLFPLFHFRQDGPDPDQTRIFMNIYAEPNRDERLVDPTIEPVFGEIESIVSSRFSLRSFAAARQNDRRIPRNSGWIYSLRQLIGDERRAQASIARSGDGHTIQDEPAGAVQAAAVPVEVTAAETIRSARREEQSAASEINFDDPANAVWQVLHMSPDEIAELGAAFEIITPGRTTGIRTDQYSSYRVVMTVGEGENQRQATTTRQELARLDDDDRDFAVLGVDRLLRERHPQRRGETDIEGYARLLEEMQIIKGERGNLSRLLIRRAESAITIIRERGGNCTFRTVNHGNYTDFEFGFPRLNQGTEDPDQVTVTPNYVRIGVRRDALERAAASEEDEGESAAASSILESVSRHEFIQPS